MMATIEPRLIHLLNTSQTPDLPPIQLLPLGGTSVGHSESLSLPPLENDAGHRAAKAGSTTQIPPFHTVTDPPQHPSRIGNAFATEPHDRPAKSGHPLQMLLGDSEANTSTLSLRMLVDDNKTPEALEDPSTKKRHRALTTKDDFVQLPQPLKKQKSTQQVVPPIIAGLHEPPPNAAVFPPITSGSFGDSDPLNPNLLKDFNTSCGGDDRGPTTSAGEGDKGNGAARVKRRAAKPRRKWSEEETNHLLLGVSRHGVGKWTSILDDPAYKFNERTAGDLKDRFRTCCPDELRGSMVTKKRAAKESQQPVELAAALPAIEDHGIPTRIKPKSGVPLENMLSDPEPPAVIVEQNDSSAAAFQPYGHHDSDSPAPRQRKSRAHRKKMEDLVELGIHGPFKKSHRRERRPFTDQDDREILEGLDQYGPAWTKIQRDRRYNLSSRQPTDLRDRVRNKYPDIYARIEKGSFLAKDTTSTPPASTSSNVRGGGGILEPIANTTMEKYPAMAGVPSGPGQELNRSTSREDMPKWVPASTFYESSSESLPTLADVFVEMGAHDMSAHYIGAPEVEIGRLALLDDDVSRHMASASGTADLHQRYGPGATYDNPANVNGNDFFTPSAATQSRYGRER